MIFDFRGYPSRPRRLRCSPIRRLHDDEPPWVHPHRDRARPPRNGIPALELEHRARAAAIPRSHRLPHQRQGDQLRRDVVRLRRSTIGSASWSAKAHGEDERQREHSRHCLAATRVVFTGMKVLRGNRTARRHHGVGIRPTVPDVADHRWRPRRLATSNSERRSSRSCLGGRIRGILGRQLAELSSTQWSLPSGCAVTGHRARDKALRGLEGSPRNGAHARRRRAPRGRSLPRGLRRALRTGGLDSAAGVLGTANSKEAFEGLRLEVGRRRGEFEVLTEDGSARSHHARGT